MGCSGRSARLPPVIYFIYLCSSFRRRKNRKLSMANGSLSYDKFQFDLECRREVYNRAEVEGFPFLAVWGGWGGV